MTGQPTELKVTFASEIRPKRQRWFYAQDGQGVIPSQTCAVFAGIGGEGKSSFAVHLAALLSRGELEGDLQGVKGTTIIFGPEDPWETVMVPRLMAAGADMSRIVKVTAESLTSYGVQERELRFPLDIGQLERVVEKLGVKLIIVDPISTAMTGDMNKVQDVREALGALAALAERQDLTVIAINHFNKAGTSISSKMSGSHAIRDVVRSYLAFATNEDTGERIITQDKNNYGTGFGSWKFELENNYIEIPGEAEHAKIPSVKLLGSSDVTVKDLIDRESSDSDDEDRNAAQAFVLDFIKQAEDGEAKAGDVIKAGRQAGFSENEIKNARRRCKNPKIVSAKSSFGSGWVWRVEESTQPEGVTQNTQGVKGAKKSGATPSTTPSPIDAKDVTKASPPQIMTPLTPSTSSTPSGDKGICFQHGTNYQVSTCKTCLALAEQAS